MGSCTEYEVRNDHTCKLIECNGEITQWSIGNHEKYCFVENAMNISCVEARRFDRMIACNILHSYGYSNAIMPPAVWVRSGCSAQFNVCYELGNSNDLTASLMDPWSNIFTNVTNLAENTTLPKTIYKDLVLSSPQHFLPGTEDKQNNTAPSKTIYTDKKLSSGPGKIPETTKTKQNLYGALNSLDKQSLSKKPYKYQDADFSNESKTLHSKHKESNQQQNKTVNVESTTSDAKLSTTNKKYHYNSKGDRTSRRLSIDSTERPELELVNTSVSTVDTTNSAINDEKINSTTTKDKSEEKDSYFVNRGVIHAGEIAIDVDGDLAHQQLSNGTIIWATDGEINYVENAEGSDLTLIFGACFGILFVLVLVACVIIFLCRSKLKRCINKKHEEHIPDTSLDQQNRQAVSTISESNPVCGIPIHESYNLQNIRGRTPRYSDLSINHQYFVLEPLPEQHVLNGQNSSVNGDDKTFNSNNHNQHYFVLENFPAELYPVRGINSENDAFRRPSYNHLNENVFLSDDVSLDYSHVARRISYNVLWENDNQAGNNIDIDGYSRVKHVRRQSDI